MKGYLKIAGVSLAAFAAVYVVQKSVFKVPVIGAYLPGGQ